ncbi:MAG TPA: polysaccharide biosynthesis C-terminal domain-containing protein [Kiritimatiellia bacterium]|jgi:O-antigen/teichoic acid export membrane protein
MTGKGGLFWGAVGNYVAFALNMLAGFLLVPIVVHHLGKETYGGWTLVITLANYYSLLDLGVTTAVTQAIAARGKRADPDGASRIINTSMAIFLRMGVFVFVVNATLGNWLLSLLSKEVSQMQDVSLTVTLVGAALAVDFAAAVFRAVSTGCEDFRAVNVGTVVKCVTKVLLAVLLLGWQPRLACVGVAHLAAALLTLAWSYFAFRRVEPDVALRPRTIDWSVGRSLIVFGGIATVIRLADIIRLPIGGFFIAKWGTIAEVGEYGIAVMLMAHGVGLVVTGTTVLTPRFSNLHADGNKAEMQRLLRESLGLSAVLAFGLAGGLILFSPGFITLWIGKEFIAAAGILAIMPLGYAFALAQMPVTNFMLGVKKHHYHACAMSVEALANVVLCFVLVPKYGARGAAWALVIPMITVKLLVQPLYVCKFAGLGLVSYFVPIVKTTLVTALILVALRDWSWLDPGATNVVKLVAGMCAYVAAVGGLGAIMVLSPEVRRKLLGKVRALFGK